VHDDAFQKLTGIEDGLASRICCHCTSDAAVVVVLCWCSASFLPSSLAISLRCATGNTDLVFRRASRCFCGGALARSHDGSRA
jgi:hypothetical protein